MTEELTIRTDGHVTTVTLNRPEARNALTFAMYEGLADICAQAPVDGSIAAIVVRGAGDRAFAAGTDMTQFRDFTKPEDAWNYERRMTSVLQRIESCAVPTIAAIAGACTGGGAAIAACCDLRISDQRLKFGFPIARTLGNCLSIDNLSRLSAMIGPSRVKEMIFTARLIGAEEALQLGLVSEVLETADAVFQRADELAQLMATHAPLTLRATKQALHRLRDQTPRADDHDLIKMCYMSADFREGMEAFLAKRTPQWQGR